MTATTATGKVNLLVAPCVSPWAYERIHRWNHDGVDPNRSFREPSPAQESAALIRLVTPLLGRFVAHVDLHETTDSDESEFRPALAARDGKPFEPGLIPDGFYLVDDTENPQPAFQAAIIAAVVSTSWCPPLGSFERVRVGSHSLDNGSMSIFTSALLPESCRVSSDVRVSATTLTKIAGSRLISSIPAKYTKNEASFATGSYAAAPYEVIAKTVPSSAIETPSGSPSVIASPG